MDAVTLPEFWVFGYGSLMWHPGFPHAESQPATLRGYRRSFCIWSRHYRGTPERPGLVLGLTAGGTCTGTAFRVPGDAVPATVAYLRERELVGYAYAEATLPVELRDGRQVAAYTFIADPAHRQFAGDLGLERTAAIVMEAGGCTGLNRDYLMNTVQQLEAHGFTDPPLHALLKEVERRTGEIEAGGGI